MLQAYCDESYVGDPKRSPRYVVAGYLGSTERWETFHDLWRNSMREERIEKFGVHASDCANGAKPYDKMADDRRRWLQRRLLIDIVTSKLLGFVAAVDTAAFHEHKPKFDAFMGSDGKQYIEPHILAVAQCVQMMCIASEDSDEEIAFFTDQNTQFGRRVEAWHQMNRKDPNIRYSHRLGPLVQADRMRALGLQAADMLAYSSLRYLLGKPSWQYQELKSAIQVVEYTSGETVWKYVTEEMPSLTSKEP